MVTRARGIDKRALNIETGKLRSLRYWRGILNISRGDENMGDRRHFQIPDRQTRRPDVTILVAP